MTAEGKRALLISCYAAALFVPIIAVPWITLSLPDWRNAPTLDDPNPAVRVAALRAIGSRGHVDLLIRGLQDEDADVRYVAAVELPARGRDAGSHVKELIALLKDEHKHVRGAAIGTLNAIGVPANPALLECSDRSRSACPFRRTCEFGACWCSEKWPRTISGRMGLVRPRPGEIARG